MPENDTKVAQILRRAHNHPVIAGVIVVAILIVSVATLTDAVDRIVEFSSKYFSGGRKTTQSTEPPVDVGASQAQARAKREGPASSGEEIDVRGQEISALLEHAEKSLVELRLTAPPETSAYRLYDRVLQLDPKNKRALIGIKSVAEKYVRLATRAIEKKEFAAADNYLEKARVADPHVSGLAAARAKLNAIGNESQAQQRDGERRREIVESLAAAVANIGTDIYARDAVVNGVKSIGFKLTGSEMATIIRSAAISTDAYMVEALQDVVVYLREPLSGSELALILEIAEISADAYATDVVETYAPILRYPLRSDEMARILNPISTDAYHLQALNALLLEGSKQHRASPH